ncbi:MAG: hypothetical protein R3F60_33585 [bacterium]
MIRAVLHAVLLGLATASCGPPPTASYRLPEDATAPEYERALAAWTRKGETYEYFESRVFVRATLFSPAFAASFATRRSQRLGMSPGEARAERSGRVGQAESEVRFFAAVVTNDPFWNDLDRGEGATLRARLMSGGEAVAPTLVKRLTDDELADMAPFFPYADPLSRGYWIVFPAPKADEDIHLRISGPPAIVNLRWKVE